MTNKLKQAAIAAILATQFSLRATAGDAPANPAPEIPAYSADAAAQAEEIKLLKQQVELLARKIDRLEQEKNPTNQEATIADLDQKVRILERQREIDQDSALAKATNAPKITLGANGFSFASADSNFVTQIHGLVQVDSRTFFHENDAKGVDGFLLRRARPIFTGTVFHDFDYNLTPDFGGNTVQIPDAYVTYRYSPEIQVQTGKFKSPVGLEALQADPATSFNERSLVTDLVPNRDLGIQLKGDLNGGVASYAIAGLNGAPDYNGTTTNVYSQNALAVVSRLFLQPWKNSDISALRGLGFGVAGSYEIDDPNTKASSGLTPGYTTDGQQKFFTYTNTAYAGGQHWRVSPQSYYYYGPFSLLGEYIVTGQRVTNGKISDNVGANAWELSGGWVLTGEDASYTGVVPRHPFDPRNGDWGAFQLVARYAQLNVDSDAFTSGLASSANSADQAQSWALGLNWFLNKNIRANISFSHTWFGGYTGGKPPSGTLVPAAQDENVLFTRIQLAF